MMAPFADIVGMTMAAEAIIAKELGLSYAALCSVDKLLQRGCGNTPHHGNDHRGREKEPGNHDDHRQHVHRKEPGMKFSKKGDTGETSLLGGQRVPKFDPRPEAYGTLDEASSVLGVARGMTGNGRIKDIILQVQKDLLVMGAEMSTLPEDMGKLGQRIGAADVDRVEDLIDRLQEEVPFPREFIYPERTPYRADRRGPHGHPPGRAPGSRSQAERAPEQRRDPQISEPARRHAVHIGPLCRRERLTLQGRRLACRPPA